MKNYKAKKIYTVKNFAICTFPAAVVHVFFHPDHAFIIYKI